MKVSKEINKVEERKIVKEDSDVVRQLQLVQVSYPRLGYLSQKQLR